MRFFVHIILGLVLLHAPLLGATDNAQDDQSSAAIAVEQPFEVGANDSVWGIASKIAKDEVEVSRITRLLFKQNPQQFIDGDINRLKIGGVLTLDLSDSIRVSTVQSVSGNLSKQRPALRVSKRAMSEDKISINAMPIEKVTDQSFLNQKVSLKNSSIQKMTLDPSHPDSEALNKDLVLSQNKAASLKKEVELLNDELQESSRRIKVLESSLAKTNPVIDGYPKSPSPAPINAKLVGSTDGGLSSQASRDRKDFMTVMTVSTLAVLLLILIIVRSGIVTRRDVLVASEPAHSTAADEQSALADPVEQYIDEFLDDDVAINTELEIADAPTAENLLDASDSQPPISKTKLPFITVSDPMDAVDQPSTAASVDLSDFNSTATQLQLSRVYIDMGDLDGAKIMLEKVLATADTQQLAIANDLISELEQLS